MWIFIPSAETQRRTWSIIRHVVEAASNFTGRSSPTTWSVTALDVSSPPTFEVFGGCTGWSTCMLYRSLRWLVSNVHQALLRKFCASSSTENDEERVNWDSLLSIASCWLAVTVTNVLLRWILFKREGLIDSLLLSRRLPGREIFF